MARLPIPVQPVPPLVSSFLRCVLRWEKRIRDVVERLARSLHPRFHRCDSFFEVWCVVEAVEPTGQLEHLRCVELIVIARLQHRPDGRDGRLGVACDREHRQAAHNERLWIRRRLASSCGVGAVIRSRR